MVTPREYDLSRLSLQRPELGLLDLSLQLPQLPQLGLGDLNLNRGREPFTPIPSPSITSIAQAEARRLAQQVEQPEVEPREEYDPSVTPEIADTEHTRQVIAEEAERQANTGFLGGLGRFGSDILNEVLDVNLNPVGVVQQALGQNIGDLKQEIADERQAQPSDEPPAPDPYTYTLGNALDDYDAYFVKPFAGTALAVINTVPLADILAFRGRHTGSETIDYFQTLIEEFARENPRGFLANYDDAFQAAYDSLDTRKFIKGTSEVILDPLNFLSPLSLGRHAIRAPRVFQGVRAAGDVSLLDATGQTLRTLGADAARDTYVNTPIRGITLGVKSIPEASKRLSYLARWRNVRSPRELAEEYDRLGGNVRLGDMRDALARMESGEVVQWNDQDFDNLSGVLSPDRISLKPFDEQLKNVTGEAVEQLTQTPETVQRLGLAARGGYSLIQGAARVLANQVYPNWTNTNIGRQIAVASARTTADSVSFAETIVNHLSTTAVPGYDLALNPTRQRAAIVPSFGDPGSRAAIQHDTRGTVTNLVGVESPDPIKHNFVRILEHYGTPEGADLEGLLTPTQELLVQRIKLTQLNMLAMEFAEGVIDEKQYEALLESGYMTRSAKYQVQLRAASDEPISSDDPDTYNIVLASIDGNSTRLGSRQDYGRQIESIEDALSRNYIYDVGEDMLNAMTMRTYSRIVAKRTSDALRPYAIRDLKKDLADKTQLAESLDKWRQQLADVGQRIAGGTRTRRQEAGTFPSLRTYGRSLGIPEDRVNADVDEIQASFEAWFKVPERTKTQLVSDAVFNVARGASVRAQEIIDEAGKSEKARIDYEAIELRAEREALAPEVESINAEIDRITAPSGPTREELRAEFMALLLDPESEFGRLGHLPFAAREVESIPEFQQWVRARRDNLRTRSRAAENRIKQIDQKLQSKRYDPDFTPTKAGVAEYRQIAERLERIANTVDLRNTPSTQIKNTIRNIEYLGRDIRELASRDDAELLVGRRFDEFLEEFNERHRGNTAKRQRRDAIQNELDRLVRRAKLDDGPTPSYLRGNILNPPEGLREYRVGQVVNLVAEVAGLQEAYDQIQRSIVGIRNEAALRRQEALRDFGDDELSDLGFDPSGRPTDVTGISPRMADELRAQGASEAEIRDLTGEVRGSQRFQADVRAEATDVSSVRRRRRIARDRSTVRGRRLRSLRDSRKQLESQLRDARMRLAKAQRFVVDYDRVQGLQEELTTLRSELAEADRVTGIESRSLTEEGFNLSKEELEMRTLVIDLLEPLWNSRQGTLKAKREVVELVNQRIGKQQEAIEIEIAQAKEAQAEIKRMGEVGEGAPDLDQSVDPVDDRYAAVYAQTHAIDAARYPELAKHWLLLPEDIRDQFAKQHLDPNSRFHGFIQTGANASSVMRFFKTSFDFGAVAIQQIAVAAYRPDLFSRTLWANIAQTFDPLYQQRYVTQNLDTILEMAYHGSPVNTSQFAEFQAFSDSSEQLQEATVVGGRGLFPTVGQRITRATAERKGIFRSMSPEVRADILRNEQRFGRAAKRTTKFFQGIFDTTGMVGRVELYKAMKPSWANSGGDLRDLSKFVNNATGYTDLQANGFTEFGEAMQRSLLFFAPRYTRAVIAMIGNAMGGGITGTEARQMLTGMWAGLTFTYYSAAAALGQEPKLDPRPKSEGGDGAEFMTLRIAGRNFGPGSKQIQLMRFAAGLLSSDWTEADMWQFWSRKFYRENPIGRFLRAQVPPTMEALINGYTNQTYLGEPLEDFPSSIAHTTRSFIPFSAETLLFDRGPNESYLSAGALLGATVEAFGGRQYPTTIWEQKRDAQNEEAQIAYGKDWDELDRLQKQTIRNDPAFRTGRLTQQANELLKDYARPPGEEGDVEIALDTMDSLVSQTKANYQRRVDAARRRFEMADPRFNSTEFKKVLNGAQRDRSAQLRGIYQSDEYVQAREVFKESFARNDNLVPAQDLAYVEYIERVSTHPDLVNDLGQRDFKLERELIDAFIRDWGQEAYDYVRQRFTVNRESEDWQTPDPIKEIAYGNELFRYYWEEPARQMAASSRFSDDIAQRLEDYHALPEGTLKDIAKEQDRELRIAIRTEQEIRNIMREQNRDLDIFIVRWHSASTLRHPDNQWVGADLHYTSGDIRLGLMSGPPYPSSVNISREGIPQGQIR